MIATLVSFALGAELMALYVFSVIAVGPAWSVLTELAMVLALAGCLIHSLNSDNRRTSR